MEVEETTKVGEETRKDQTRVVQKVEVEVPLHHCHLNEYLFLVQDYFQEGYSEMYKSKAGF